MTAMGVHGVNKKRKHAVEESQEPTPFPGQVELQILSDEEGEEGEGGASDDGEVDEFVEIDPDSESEEGYSEGSEGEDSDEEDSDKEEIEGEEEDVDSDGHSSEDSVLRVFPRGKTIVSDITGQQKRVYPEIEPEYNSDSSTEDAPNRVGNIPMHWYDDLPHVGYDINGRRVLRPAKGDELDKFLQTVEDPAAWTSVFDKNTQMDKPLTAGELDIIRRLQANEVPDAQYNPYEPTTEWFTGKGKEEVMPISAAPEPKRRWVPSKWEKQKVMKIVRAIRQGRILPNKPKTTDSKPQFYAIWNEPPSTHPAPLPAPKKPHPTNSESYNPPAEYLFTAEERAKWEATDPEDREQDYLPQKYSALRLVPAYAQFIKERFNRQLDLYLAPRVQRKKLNIDPNELLPKLPSPSSLKPFPNYRCLKFLHEKGRARALSVSPDGTWVVSGDDDGVVSLWEIIVGKELKRWKFGSAIGTIEWCPRLDASFFVVGVGEALHFLIPPHLPPNVLGLTMSLLVLTSLPELPPPPITWVHRPTGISSPDEPILSINLPPSSGLPKQVAWHRKGDYMASVSSGEGQSVWIHQITKHHSQAPFHKVRGVIQLVLFHPLKPNFFVATQRYVRVYNLSEQRLVKTLTTGIRWISSLDVHPSGEHLIVGGYDRKLCWFDLELSDKPYKVLRYHTRAIRSLQFHPIYPLFASSSDDGSIQVFHGRVYNDSMTDPLIVPLKVLRGHDIKDGLGVLQIRWCSRQPWLVSAGADGSVAVWCS